MKKLFTLFLIVFLGGCAYRNPLSEMKFQTITAPPYVVAGWYRIDLTGQPLRVYVEGDGNAFDIHGYPTDNPTPKGDFMRRLAAGDPNPNVVYLGRPCQYLKTSACSVYDWTTGRFSPEIIDSMETALLDMMKKARTNQVTLIGFSGGAMVTGLLAVRHPEKIKKWITIAGVLDHEAWTNHHGDTPLDKSLNLKIYQDKLQNLPQHHYAGAKDTVVPTGLIRDVVGNENVTVVPKASHGKGFESVYDEIYGG